MLDLMGGGLKKTMRLGMGEEGHRSVEWKRNGSV